MNKHVWDVQGVRVRRRLAEILGLPVLSESDEQRILGNPPSAELCDRVDKWLAEAREHGITSPVDITMLPNQMIDVVWHLPGPDHYIAIIDVVFYPTKVAGTVWWLDPEHDFDFICGSPRELAEFVNAVGRGADLMLETPPEERRLFNADAVTPVDAVAYLKWLRGEKP
jgi:hypothetical protein